jgi:uncharacterized protein
MQIYIPRNLEDKLARKLDNMPAVAILGARQTGKSTLAKKYLAGQKHSIYLDLEKPGDLNKLQNPEAFFEVNSEKLVCLDEIQRSPDLFPLLRSILDERGRNGQILILGSASRDLLKQSSESLAGRISYLELSPFLLSEINLPEDQTRELWLKGGFPRSFLNQDLNGSFEWREDFIRTYLERDIPQLGFRIPADIIGRFWRMLAHVNGQVLNASNLGSALGTSHHSIKNYINILEQTFLLRVLLPFAANLKKRLIKSPKIYFRDTGLLHTILGIRDHNDLLSHPVYGLSWEGYVIENICSECSDWRPSFFRTSSGAEIDLILERGQKRIAIEIKASSAPKVSKSFWNLLEELKFDEAWVIAPVDGDYPLKNGVKVAPLNVLINHLKS